MTEQGMLPADAIENIEEIKASYHQVIGVTVGLVILVLLVIGGMSIAYCCFLKKKKSLEKNDNASYVGYNTSTIAKGLSGGAGEISMLASAYEETSAKKKDKDEVILMDESMNMLSKDKVNDEAIQRENFQEISQFDMTVYKIEMPSQDSLKGIRGSMNNSDSTDRSSNSNLRHEKVVTDRSLLNGVQTDANTSISSVNYFTVTLQDNLNEISAKFDALFTETMEGDECPAEEMNSILQIFKEDNLIDQVEQKAALNVEEGTESNTENNDLAISSGENEDNSKSFLADNLIQEVEAKLDEDDDKAGEKSIMKEDKNKFEIPSEEDVADSKDDDKIVTDENLEEISEKTKENNNPNNCEHLSKKYVAISEDDYKNLVDVIGVAESADVTSSSENENSNSKDENYNGSDDEDKHENSKTSELELGIKMSQSVLRDIIADYMKDKSLVKMDEEVQSKDGGVKLQERHLSRISNSSCLSHPGSEFEIDQQAAGDLLQPSEENKLCIPRQDSMANVFEWDSTFDNIKTEENSMRLITTPRVERSTKSFLKVESCALGMLNMSDFQPSTKKNRRRSNSLDGICIAETSTPRQMVKDQHQKNPKGLCYTPVYGHLIRNAASRSENALFETPTKSANLHPELPSTPITHPPVADNLDQTGNNSQIELSEDAKEDGTDAENKGHSKVELSLVADTSDYCDSSDSKEISDSSNSKVDSQASSLQWDNSADLLQVRDDSESDKNAAFLHRRSSEVSPFVDVSLNQSTPKMEIFNKSANQSGFLSNGGVPILNKTGLDGGAEEYLDSSEDVFIDYLKDMKKNVGDGDLGNDSHKDTEAENGDTRVSVENVGEGSEGKSDDKEEFNEKSSESLRNTEQVASPSIGNVENNTKESPESRNVDIDQDIAEEKEASPISINGNGVHYKIEKELSSSDQFCAEMNRVGKFSAEENFDGLKLKIDFAPDDDHAANSDGDCDAVDKSLAVFAESMSNSMLSRASLRQSNSSDDNSNAGYFTADER